MTCHRRIVVPLQYPLRYKWNQQIYNISQFGSLLTILLQCYSMVSRKFLLITLLSLHIIWIWNNVKWSMCRANLSFLTKNFKNIVHVSTLVFYFGPMIAKNEVDVACLLQFLPICYDSFTWIFAEENLEAVYWYWW